MTAAETGPKHRLLSRLLALLPRRVKEEVGEEEVSEEEVARIPSGLSPEEREDVVARAVAEAPTLSEEEARALSFWRLVGQELQAVMRESDAHADRLYSAAEKERPTNAYRADVTESKAGSNVFWARESEALLRMCRHWRVSALPVDDQPNARALVCRYAWSTARPPHDLLSMARFTRRERAEREAVAES